MKKINQDVEFLICPFCGAMLIKEGGGVKCIDCGYEEEDD